MDEYSDDGFLWQKGINLLTFKDKSEIFHIYPAEYNTVNFIDSSYIERVDLIILKMGIR